ncbi:MAG TPA: VWA domain-containing protein, partial [Chloroflexia bacterium]|nr:VWA domain-containing protein [Chloroflexia bacterium]
MPAGFFTPLALLALPLLGAIVALYLLRMRRPGAPIASLQHWGDLRRDREANALWQRLQGSLLMVLQLVALLALIVAVARPWTVAGERQEGNAVIIVDVSASMASRDAEVRSSTTRLEAAKGRALKLVDDLQEGNTAAVISAGGRATILVPGVDDKSRLRAAIRGLVPQNTQADMVSALKLAGALISRQARSTVWVLSDGRFGQTAEQVGSVNAELHFVPFGRDTQNQAISALSLRAAPAALDL